MKNAVAVVLVSFLLILTIALSAQYFSENETKEAEPCYVGVAFCGNTTSEAKLLIDRVKTYTNLFVVQSGPISENETALNEICDYAVNADLSIIVYFGDLDSRFMDESKFWRIPWLSFAKQEWGNRLLGVQYYDEPGGFYIDMNRTEWVFGLNATLENLDYDWAANRFNRLRDDRGFAELKANDIEAFVSDYALYWFDYLAGYDVVLAQIGWNHTIEQDIALLRGAAQWQNKMWGAIVTWKYNQPPYLDSGANIFLQMQNAYQAGAKYVVIFNYPTIDGNDYGVMYDEHFEALENFWNNVVKNQNVDQGSVEVEAVLVLPKNYGWGMRHPEDRIWGWWGPDEKSPQIWSLSRELLSTYGFRLDIVYDSSEFPVEGKYQQIYYWNQTLNSR